MFRFAYAFDATKIFTMHCVEYAKHIASLDTHYIGEIVRVIYEIGNSNDITHNL